MTQRDEDPMASKYTLGNSLYRESKLASVSWVLVPILVTLAVIAAFFQ